MKLKPTLITLGIMITFVVSMFISIAGKPLIYWILIIGITLFCLTAIFFEIYGALTD